jgi:hypothetical protein
MKNNTIEKRIQALETISVLGAVFIVLHMAFGHRAFLFVSIGLLSIGIFFKDLSYLISTGWKKFSHVIGLIMNHIILAAVFFLLLTPISILYRLFSRNPLQLKLKYLNGTVFKDRHYSYTDKDFHKMW